MNTAIETLKKELDSLKNMMMYYEHSKSDIYKHHIESKKIAIEEHERAIGTLINHKRAMQWEDN